jgi:hypothetical protein
MKYLKTSNMNLKNYFELSRFWLLLKMELSRSRKGVLMALVIIFGSLFILGLLLGPILDPGMVVFEHSPTYAFTLLIGGFILSSMAYRDLSNSLRRHNYLTLPASTFEKFLSMWLLTSVGWILLYTVLYTIYTIFANALGPLLYDHLTFVPFEPLGPSATKIMKFYFVLQGVFLAGAAHFKGYPFPKTLLTLVLLGTVCGVIMYFIMKGLFDFDMSSDPDIFNGMPSAHMWKVMQWLFWWILAPLCLVITYLGLKEQEV